MLNIVLRIKLLNDLILNILYCVGASMFQYYIKIVPTIFQRRDNSIFSTNQFSVTKHTVNYNFYILGVEKNIYLFIINDIT